MKPRPLPGMPQCPPSPHLKALLVTQTPDGFHLERLTEDGASPGNTQHDTLNYLRARPLMLLYRYTSVAGRTLRYTRHTRGVSGAAWFEPSFRSPAQYNPEVKT